MNGIINIKIIKLFFPMLILIALPPFFYAAKLTEPVRIIYYLWDDLSNHTIVDAFNAAQTAVQVNAQYLPLNEYEAKLTTLLAVGAEMDAYMMKRQTDAFNYYANGYMYPLNELIQESGEIIPAVANHLAVITVDSKIIGIPFRGAGWFTYFNKKLFAETGIPTPDQWVDRGMWTWDKFSEIARILSSGDGKRYGAFIFSWGASQVIPCLQNGMQFITQDGRLDINEAVFLKSFKLRKNLEKVKALYPLLEMKVTKLHYSSAFYSGRIGMLLMGEWFPNFMRIGKEQNLLQNFSWNDWSVTVLPCDEKEYCSFGNPPYNTIHPDSKYKKAAFQFIKWMGSKNGAEVVAKIGALPADITGNVKAIFRSLIPDQKGFEAYFTPQKINPQLLNKYGSKIELMLSNLMDEYLSREMTDRELLELLKNQLEEITHTSE